MRKRKVSIEHITDITSITLATMQQYTEFCKLRKEEDDLAAAALREDVNMHFEDLLHMQAALHKFVQDRDADALQDAIMTQDTFVREYYINTLLYLEDEGLVSENVCC